MVDAGVVMIGLVLGLVAMAANNAGATPPVRPANWATLITSDDYPPDADRAREHGTTSYLLQIAVDGTVRACLITRSSGSVELDATTCRLLTERARFQPARDGAGRAVEGTFRGRINWELPNDNQMPPELNTLIRTWIVEKDATASDCRYRYVHPNDPVASQWRTMACPEYGAMQPFRDAAGKPVRKRLTYTWAVTAEDVP